MLCSSRFCEHMFVSARNSVHRAPQRGDSVVHDPQGPSGNYDCASYPAPCPSHSDELATCQPSPRVAVIKFQKGIQQGLLGRIGRSATMEYHGFGIISEGIESGCHYIIAGVQGDWTRGLVNDPPKFLWTRELKVRPSPSPLPVTTC